jgi:hypothetical protein
MPVWAKAEQTINAIGLFGPWGAGIAIGLGTIDAVG